MSPCYSCKSQPQLINGEHGQYYQCPQCYVSTKAWSDEQAALEDWDKRMVHQWPAGFKEMVNAD